MNDIMENSLTKRYNLHAIEKISCFFPSILQLSGKNITSLQLFYM